MRENAKILWQEHTCLLEEEKDSVYDWDKARTGESGRRHCQRDKTNSKWVKHLTVRTEIIHSQKKTQGSIDMTLNLVMDSYI